MLTGSVVGTDLPPPQVLGLVGWYLLGGMLGAVLAGYALRRRGEEATARAFGYLALVAPLVCFGLAGRVLATTLGAKLLWNVVVYLGWVAVGPAVFVFALRYVGAREWVSRRVILALSVVPAVTLLLVATTQFHTLHYSEVGLRYVDGWPIARLIPGPWLWVHVTYEYGLVLLVVGILSYYAVSATAPFRGQAATLVLALLLMAGTNAAFLFFGIGPFPGGDLTPFGIVVGLLAIGFAVFRVRLIDVVPVARDRVFEALDDAVVVVDPNGRVVDTNPAAETLVDAGTAVPTAVDALPRSVVESGLLENDDADSREFALTVDGDERWLLVRRQPVGGGAFALIFSDVTARHEREDRLEQFAGVLSHDLRNPLSVASGNIDLARDAEEPEPHLDAAAGAIDRTNRMVDDLLTLAREGSAVTDPEPVDLAAVARAAWETVDTLDADLTVADTTTLSGDFDRLQRAFENLFRNAIEHGRSDVAVTVGIMDDGTGFFVADDGPGIPEDARETVFDRGYTTGGSGAGLGLSIVTDAAEAHGWSVEATESESGGARFEFRTD